MSVSVLHPAGFVETGGCSGPRNVRIQPSRESPGVLLDEANKYVTDFNLPFRNSVRALKTFKLNWNKVPKEDREKIMEIIGPIEIKQVTVQEPVQVPKSFSLFDTLYPDSKIVSVTDFLNRIFSPEKKENYGTEEASSELQTEVNMWILKKYWIVLFIIVVLVLVIFFLIMKNPRTLFM